MVKELSVVFICQKGDLEIKAALLAASLRYYWGKNIDLHCGIPTINGINTNPQDQTIDFLESLDIRVFKFSNPLIDNEPGPVPGLEFSNKLFCFPENIDSNRVLFLDTDVICLKEPDLGINIESEFASCQAFRSLDLDWKELYALTDIPEPRIKVKSILDGKIGPPYFNSGVFVISTGLLELFLGEWQKLFHLSRETMNANKHLHHSDQISLSLAVQKLELSFEILSENYNYPSGSKMAHENTCFAHYHGPEKISSDPLLYQTTITLANKYPEIKKIAGNYNFWNEMISHSRHPLRLNMIYQIRKFIRKRRI